MTSSACNLLKNFLLTSITEHLPSFDANGLESQVFNIAYQDLINFLKFTFRIEEEDDLDAKLIDMILSDLETWKTEIEAFASLWSQSWKKKTKIVFTQEEKKNYKSVEGKIEKGSSKLDAKTIHELSTYLIYHFLRKGDLCCTTQMAEQFLKYEASGFTKIETIQERMALVKKVLVKVDALSGSTSPMIFLNLPRTFR